MYYEALRLHVESVMTMRVGRLRARYLASDGTRNWDDLWSGTIPTISTDEPLDEIHYVLTVILDDLATERSGLERPPLPPGEF